MIEQQNSEIEKLQRRLDQLEKRAGGGKRRGWTNLRGGAEYVGRSQEWLRQQIQAGRVKHSRQGRYLNISYDALDDLIIMLGEETTA